METGLLKQSHAFIKAFSKYSSETEWNSLVDYPYHQVHLEGVELTHS